MLDLQDRNNCFSELLMNVSDCTYYGYRRGERDDSSNKHSIVQSLLSCVVHEEVSLRDRHVVHGSGFQVRSSAVGSTSDD